jgi:hypothetical protein
MRSNTDTLELYSFVINLYAFFLYYRYLFTYNIFAMFAIKSMTFLFFKFILKKNFFSILGHKYITHNTFDIAIPQISNSVFNVFILPRNMYIACPLSCAVIYFINTTFPTESETSKKLRYYLIIFFIMVVNNT